MSNDKVVNLPIITIEYIETFTCQRRQGGPFPIYGYNLLMVLDVTG